MASVLIFAIDGLQPSQVTEELMPNLAAFASDGVFFDNHHPVYPSVTRVNAASIMTGCYPGRHGLVGNTLVIREYDRNRAFSALVDELATVVEKTGRLLFPSYARGDSSPGHDKRFVTVGTGSSGNTFVHNPKPQAGHGRSIHPEFTIPEDLGASIVERFGEWGERTDPDYGRNEYASRILTEYVLDDCDLAVYWCDEPDHAQHAAGVNSELGKASARRRRRCLQQSHRAPGRERSSERDRHHDRVRPRLLDLTGPYRHRVARQARVPCTGRTWNERGVAPVLGARQEHG